MRSKAEMNVFMGEHLRSLQITMAFKEFVKSPISALITFPPFRVF